MSNHFECVNTKAGAINLTGSQIRDIDIIENNIYGAASWGNTMMKAVHQKISMFRATILIVPTGRYILLSQIVSKSQIIP